MQKFKKAVGILLASLIFAINFTPQMQYIRNLPDTIVLTPQTSQSLSFAFPLTAELGSQEMAEVTASQGETLYELGITPLKVGQSTLTLKLFGIIPVKTVDLKIQSERILIPGGDALGIALWTQGVFVIDVTSIADSAGDFVSPARDAGIAAGDVILAVGGEDVSSVQEMTDKLQRMGPNVTLRVRRDGRTFDVQVTPVRDKNDGYRLGIWARDSTAGIGTRTFTDPVTLTFGALGHAITDGDTGLILPAGGGEAYPASIVGVTRGQRGQPGELQGVFGEGARALGTITSNTQFGVFGTMNAAPVSQFYPSGLPIGTQAMVHEGPATIIATVDERGPRQYSVNIVKKVSQSSPATRSMVVEVTDPELLSITGGIVQGMSGSPIIQDNRLIGAVTHVYVNDPTRGYGIYIEWML